MVIMQKMKEGYEDGDVTPYPTQVFTVNNWALKPNQPEEPLFTDHMLAICLAAKSVVFNASKPSLYSERVPQGTKPRAQPGYKKHSTSLKQPSVSSRKATKASTPVVAEMHKEDLQATGGPTSLGLTSEERAQLSIGMSAFNLNEPIFSSSFIIHSESALGNEAFVVSTAKADHGKSAPRKGVSFIARQVEENEASRTIKLEDLAKLVSSVQLSSKDLDSTEDDPIILVDDSDEDEEVDEVHATTNAETKDTLVPKSSSPRAQPFFPNMGHLNELLVKSLQSEFSKILSAHDFSSSLPTELKELSYKFNELAEEVKGVKKQVHDLEIKLPGELKEIPTKLEDFTKTVTSLTSQVAELKTLHLLYKVTYALNQFAQAIASKKTEDDNIPSAGQVSTQPPEGEKNTNQATISQLFQRQAAKNANLTKQQSKPTPPTTTPIIPPKDKGKKALSSEKAEKESTDSDSDDDETHVAGSMVESSRIKKVNKFDFVTEDGKHIHLTEVQINQQKKIEEEAKAKAAKHESEVRKEELVDLLGPDVVNKYYNFKLQYDRYCDKMLNRRAESRITNCDVLTRKGPITFKVTKKGWTTIYDQIRTRMDYIHTAEAKLGINLDIPLSKQDPLDKLNDFANKKRKHADDIHDYFKANKKLKSSVQYEDHLAGTVLNELILSMILFTSYHKQDFVTIEDLKDFLNTMLYIVQEIFFRLHQGLGLDDHARTFSSLLLAEVDRRNLNLLNQMRVIKQLRK
ncbi:hypothetical protein Tco_1239682 [Tanacetum coccineum]